MTGLLKLIKDHYRATILLVILCLFLFPDTSIAAYDNGTCGKASKGATCEPNTCPAAKSNNLGECFKARGSQYYCCAPAPPPSKYDYTPLEPLFTEEKSGNFVDYMQSIYKFAIWTVGIAALLMLVIGGFMYMTSAGNQANAGTAKKIITDALLGLVVVLFAWVILYLINPDLIKINLKSIGNLKVSLDDYTGSTGHPTVPSTGGIGSAGNCDMVTSGECSPTSLKAACPLMSDGDAVLMSQVCNKESGGKADSMSGSDICGNHDNKSFSGGLFQINVFAHDESMGCGDVGSKGTCGKRRVPGDSTSPCLSWNCNIPDIARFDACVAKTKDPNANLQMMCDLSRAGQNRTPWACSANQCNVGGVTSKVRAVRDMCKNL